jgi:predicted secreted Zn-dependent protease
MPLIPGLWAVRAVSGVLVTALAGACASGAPARLPGAVVDPMADAFVWSAARPLTWADFQGKAQVTSGAAALSVYVTSYDTHCTGPVFAPRVVSRFLPNVSWVKTQYLMTPQSSQILRHEQIHFDLSEVQARRARQELRALPSPCTLSDEYFDQLFETHGRRGTEIQQQYDRETLHGTDIRRQNEWQTRVEQWLRELPQ